MHRISPCVLCILAALLCHAHAGAKPEPLAGEAAGATADAIADPTHPITRIARDGFEVSYFTAHPFPSRVQIRDEGREGSYAARALRGQTADPWAGKGVRTVEGPAGERTLHHVSIAGLDPGKRYDYRIYDPGVEPTSQESRWGAAAPWRREFAVSTLAPAGHKTLVRYPVKVLLMPNVLNIESAFKDPAKPATIPEKVTPEQLQQIREELNLASRFFFVNSHMRLWVDFTVVVDDRWQRWGAEPAAAQDFYKGWPLCRSHAGEEYHAPGGGRFTFVDTDDLTRLVEKPLVESNPFMGQVEIAFPRRWDSAKNAWTYATSGGGTLGVDSVPDGIPARSQFFGGYDTAWLATHEVHHQLESLGAFSLANREDERIVFNHWAPRSRTRGPDAASGPQGSRGLHPWSTSDRHGEHYDGMAFWDRTLTDAQWLRMALTETVVVADADEDGFPDDDPRLPIDERRFGSRSDTPTTDGRMNDLDKAMLSTWAPAPLQARFQKPPQAFARPKPSDADSDGDGLPDDIDPYPLIPYEPFVWPLSPTIDGDGKEWSDIPLAGSLSRPGLELQFRQAHDASAYYGCFRAKGDWASIRLVLDPEGRGVYSSDSVQAIRVLNGEPIKVDSKDRFFPRAPGLTWAAKRDPDGWATVEFSVPNGGSGGEGLMYWRGAGREVGSAIEVIAPDGRNWSVHEPYRLFYCRMLERPGKDPMPGDPPGELKADAEGVVKLLPGDERFKTRGAGWKLEGGSYRHSGPSEDALFIDDLNAGDFDLWASLECRSDAILGAFTPNGDIGATHDYIAFVGGYSNTRSRLRLFGSEIGDTAAVVSPTNVRHTVQLSRRAGVVWCLWDARPILWAADSEPGRAVQRLAVLGGYGGSQVLHELRYRVLPPAAAGAKVEPPKP